MVKYTDAQVVFREIPDEIVLAINISNCPIHCEGCHSKELWKNIGKDLSQRALERLISENSGISCVCFMGGDSEPEVIELLAQVIKRKFPELKVGWYSGANHFYENINYKYFDYIKIGPYIEECGSLNNPNTNQKLFKKVESIEESTGESIFNFENITYKFWENG